jgi:hypothetical protein
MSPYARGLIAVLAARRAIGAAVSAIPRRAALTVVLATLGGLLVVG